MAGGGGGGGRKMAKYDQYFGGGGGGEWMVMATAYRGLFCITVDARQHTQSDANSMLV